MAQTKTKRAKPATKSKASGSAKTSKAKPKAARKSTAGKTKARPKSSSSRPKPAHSNGNGISHGVGDGAKAVRDAVGSAGKGAGHAVSKAKVPLLAGGAAVVSTVGGIALGANRSGDKVLGIKLPKTKRVKLRSKDLSKVAKEVGRFGENVGELTTELKQAREGLVNGEGKHNSPIEVLLNGLTSRR